MSEVKIIEIDTSVVSEDVRTEIERVIATMTDAMLARFFVSNQSMIYDMKEGSKPHFRTLIQLIHGLEYSEGKDLVARFQLLLDDDGKPIFAVVVYKTGTNDIVFPFEYVRFLTGTDLWQLYYARAHEGLSDTLNDDMNIKQFVSTDFYTSASAIIENNHVFFV